MTIEPCPPQKSFCATWAGNFGTFDKGIQWGLECSPGKRSKGERAEDRENTTKTPQIIIFHQKKFFDQNVFFKKHIFSPHFAKWYDHWLKWQSSYVTVFSFALYIYQLYFLWVNKVISITRNEITGANKSAPVLGTWTPVLTLNPIPGPSVSFVIYS